VSSSVAFSNLQPARLDNDNPEPRMRVRLIAAISCVLATCFVAHDAVSSTFAEKISGSGGIRLTGWAKLRGELMIYADRESVDRASRFPHCISGVFRNQAEMKLSKFDGKIVTVTGVLYRYSELPDEQRPLLKRKVLAGSVVPNFCFGTNVLLIQTIKLTSDSHMSPQSPAPEVTP